MIANYIIVFILKVLKLGNTNVPTVDLRQILILT